MFFGCKPRRFHCGNLCNVNFLPRLYNVCVKRMQIADPYPGTRLGHAFKSSLYSWPCPGNVDAVCLLHTWGLYEPCNNIDNDCHWRNGISKSGVLFTCPVLWSNRRSRYFTTPAKYHGSFGITQIIDAVMPAHAFAVEFIYNIFVTM